MEKGASGKLHIAMVPWLAMGHLIPFMELSKRIALQGHRVSFLSTPKNIARIIPAVVPNLSHLIHLIPLPLPPTENLPAGAEASVDLPSDDLRPYLRIAYDGLEDRVSEFIRTDAPDWIIIDYAPYWVPEVAARFGVPCAFLCLFSGAVMSFYGPSSALDGPLARTTPEEFCKVPEWIPFESSIRYYGHEARQLFEPGVVPDESGVSEAYRFAKVIENCKVVAIRSCAEYEARWLDLLGKIYRKPVIPVGVFTPRPEGNVPTEIAAWLDKQTEGSVVYAAFGSEAKLTTAQVQQIALGLQMSRLPFLLAVRDPNMLPEDFEQGIKDRGFICKGWAPQVSILSHVSVGGFLTHCGWNSIVEGLAFGVKLILLPLMFDQGLNSRDMVERGVGVEVARNVDTDGSFAARDVAESLKMVMGESQGEELMRCRVNEYQKVFGDEQLNEDCLRGFLAYLAENRNLV